MQFSDILQLLTPFDLGAALFIMVVWIGIGARIENASAKTPSVSVLMKQYRRDWMKEFVTRQPRIFDASILGSLRQGTTFFASSTMIAIGGGLAVMGNADAVASLAEDFNISQAPAIVWDIKIAFVLLFVTNSFLKFVWAHRLFGYCSVVMAAVPNDITDPAALPKAAQAAELNISAARSFNRGLRAIYFAITALFWLLGPVALVLATLFTLSIIWRREFNSHSRTVLMQTQPKAG
ncbi:DUF599 domain-containing protein [Algirhabdus cladophorae]|uniref:DUF599 domain-containing protein n=1 Tax=Algirhabdus cladophorae TaxID=3377108 RepID=UPI003B847D44